MQIRVTYFLSRIFLTLLLFISYSTFSQDVSDEYNRLQTRLLELVEEEKMAMTRIGYLFLLTSLIVGCAPKFTESTFVTDNGDSYECIILTPKESEGYFIYMSDSNDFISYPTPLMVEMLKRDYTVVIPERWGDNARSRGKLDSYDNRLQGVSYAITEILGDSVFNTIFFAEGFYTPIATLLARDYHPDELWMIEPMGLSLSQTVLYQHLKNADTSAFYQYWELNSLEDMTPFTRLQDDEDPELIVHEFFGPHYSRFIQSYWTLENTISLISQTEGVDTKVIFHKDYLFHTPENEALWELEKTMSIPVPEEMDTVNYSVLNLEKLFLEE